MSDFAIETREIDKSFGSLKVLKSVSFQADAHSLTALIGPSGSGKSTLLRCLNLLEHPDSGALMIDGHDLKYNALTPKELALHRKSMGMVFQDFQLFEHMSVLDNVICAPRLHRQGSEEELKNSAVQLLSQVGMQEKIHERPANLSGGQKQRVAIARSLALKPRFLLLDEPTSALDIELISGINELLSALKSTHMTMILVSHDLNFVYQVADRLIFMDEGEIVESGGAKAVLENPQTSRLQQFLADCRFQ